MTTGEEELDDQRFQDYKENQNRLKMCLESFMLRVRDDVSFSCSIPVKIPDRNLINIIKRCKEWFYKHYEYSVEDAFLFISQEAFKSSEFAANRSITLPEDVFSVYGVHKTDVRRFDVGKQFLQYSNNYINYGLMYNSQEDLMGFVIAESYDSLRQQLLIKKYMTYNYNELTNKFTVLGEIPGSDIILEVYKKLDDCSLFQDELFLRYVVAHCRKNIGVIMGFFTYTLPGNITVNSDLIQSMGQEEIDKIEEEVKTDEGTDWFMIGS